MFCPKQPLGRPQLTSGWQSCVWLCSVGQAGQKIVCSSFIGAITEVGLAPQPISSEYGSPTYQSKPRSSGWWPFAVPRCLRTHNQAWQHFHQPGSSMACLSSVPYHFPIMPVR
jgi:hypothetical protein